VGPDLRDPLGGLEYRWRGDGPLYFVAFCHVGEPCDLSGGADPLRGLTWFVRYRGDEINSNAESGRLGGTGLFWSGPIVTFTLGQVSQWTDQTELKYPVTVSGNIQAFHSGLNPPVKFLDLNVRGSGDLFVYPAWELVEAKPGGSIFFRRGVASFSGVAEPVPEPATWVLTALVAALAGVRRLRRAT
jgi:hypothetical protein